MSTTARAALNCPVPSTERNLFTAKRLIVRHPGYEEKTNDLLSFVATDGTAADPGVELGVVHTACAIVADNRFDGWLSESRDPLQPRVSQQSSDLLPTGEYYFHVPPSTDSPNEPYPIVPNFPSWTFPHNTLPASWLSSPIASITRPSPAKTRDSTCRITLHAESTEAAHIVPRSAKDWFAANGMDIYCQYASKQGRDAADGDDNLILLRMDLHKLWDRMQFSIVPKVDPQKKSYAWVAHVNNPSQELHHLYHNLSLQPLSGIQRQYLFARFAWDLFYNLQGFLQRNVPRRLKVHSIVRDYSADQCYSFCEDQGPHRSASPKKASRSPTKRQRVDTALAYCSPRSSVTSSISYGHRGSFSSWTQSTSESDEGDGDDDAGDDVSDGSMDERSSASTDEDRRDQREGQTSSNKRRKGMQSRDCPSSPHHAYFEQRCVQQVDHDEYEARGRKRRRSGS